MERINLTIDVYIYTSSAGNYDSQMAIKFWLMAPKWKVVRWRILTVLVRESVESKRMITYKVDGCSGPCLKWCWTRLGRKGGDGIEDDDDCVNMKVICWRAGSLRGCSRCVFYHLYIFVCTRIHLCGQCCCGYACSLGLTCLELPVGVSRNEVETAGLVIVYT